MANSLLPQGDLHGKNRNVEKQFSSRGDSALPPHLELSRNFFGITTKGGGAWHQVKEGQELLSMLYILQSAHYKELPSPKRQQNHC